MLNDKEHLEVLHRVVLFAGVAVSHLERPLLHVQHFGAESAEFDVTAVFAEIVDALFREQGLHVEKSVTHGDERNVFEHEKFHWTDVVLGEFLIEIGAALEEEGHQRSQLLLL